MDLLLEMMVKGVVWPGIVSFATLSLGHWLPLANRVKRIMGGLSLAAGFLTGYMLVDAPLRPKVPWHWLPHLAALAILPILIHLLPRLGGIGRWVAPAAIAGLSAWLLIPDREEARGWWLLGLGSVVYLNWLLLSRATETMPMGRVLISCLLAAMATTIVALCAQSLRFAQLGSALAAVMGSGLVLVLWKPRNDVVRGMMPGFAILLTGILAETRIYTFSEVPAASFVLVAVCSLGLGLDWLPWMKRLSGPLRSSIVIASVILAVGSGLALALAASPPWAETE